MANNLIYQFGTATNANVASDAAWAADTSTVSFGFTAGRAPSAKANKAWRQSLNPTAGFAQFVVDWSNQDFTDSLTPTNVSTNMRIAVASAIDGARMGVDTGTTPNQITFPLNPLPPTLNGNRVIWFRPGATNTGAATATILTAGGTPAFPALNVKRKDGQDPRAGDLVAGVWYSATSDGSTLKLLAPATSEIMALVAGVTLSDSAVYYVNATTGSDSNDGKTGATAFATLQQAANVVAQFNLNGYGISVNVANGTYGRVELKPINGSGTISFVGNTTTPANCIIASSQGSAIRGSSVGAGYSFNGFSVSSAAVNATTADPGCGVLATGQTGLTISNISFSGCAGPHVEAANGAQIILGSGTFTITGSPGKNVYAPSGAFLYSAGAGSSIGSQGFSDGNGRPSLIYNTTITTDYFIIASVLAQTTVLFSSIGGSGSFATTGGRYLANLNAIMNTNGSGANIYPGTAAGVTQTGGQYV